jgi:hypothetical protein
MAVIIGVALRGADLISVARWKDPQAHDRALREQPAGVQPTGLQRTAGSVSRGPLSRQSAH